MLETSRLNFLIQRDGMEGALEFARRTLVSYRRHVLSGKFDKLMMRRGFIESYLTFKRFIKQHG